MAAVYSQDGKMMRVTTPAGTDVLLLESLSAYESVSEPFELTLDMISVNARVNPDQLLRKPVTVTVQLHDGTTRFFHGVVRRFTQGPRVDPFVSYRAEVVPALWFLTLTTDCRVFQQLSVPDIVEQVLKEAGITDLRVALTGTYSPREYCVQYRESNFAFISRLLEEEGIFYFFEHTEDKHTMVLADATSAVKPGPVESLEVTFGDNDTLILGGHIASFEVENLVRPGKVTLADYNDTMPKKIEASSIGATAKASSKGLALYDYPGKFDAAASGDRFARLRLEAEEALACVATGVTNYRGLGSGQKLDVTGHYNGDVNQSYHILSVTHSGFVGGYRAGAAGASEMGSRYESRFSAIPHKVPYRPIQRTPKAVVQGTQTAVVVGPSNEEIYVDKYSRVKVQFFWDRNGENNEKSSCWVRVSSAWAGKNWGAIHIPRIGQEVIVDFLEGDPDRPIITGRVYNAEQLPPYGLPDNGTQSGIKSRSSKKGGPENANELRFEDLKGSEQIFLHAEKDLSTVVLNDETRDVQHDRTTTIKNNDTKTVKEGNESTTIEKGNRSVKVSKGNQEIMVAEGDETYTIDKGKQTVTIDKDRSITIKTGNDSLTVQTGNLSTSVDKGNVKSEVKMGNHETKVSMGNVTLKAALGSITYDAMQGIELKVGGSSIKIGPDGITIKGPKVAIQADTMADIKGAMTSVKADAMLTMKGGVTMIN
jgi:type VI secretion system secreted protein VgrG